MGVTIMSNKSIKSNNYVHGRLSIPDSTFKQNKKEDNYYKKYIRIYQIVEEYVSYEIAVSKSMATIVIATKAYM